MKVLPVLSLMYLFQNPNYLCVSTYPSYHSFNIKLTFLLVFCPLAFNLIHHYRSFTCLIKFILMLEYFLCVHSSTIMFPFSFVEIELVFLLTLYQRAFNSMQHCNAVNFTQG